MGYFGGVGKSVSGWTGNSLEIHPIHQTFVVTWVLDTTEVLQMIVATPWGLQHLYAVRI